MCLYNDPPFLRKSYTHWPRFSLQSTPNDPFFSNVQRKISIFSRISKSSPIFRWKRRIFTQIWQKHTPNVPPILGSSHQKRPIFFLITHAMTPFFLQNPTPNALCFSFSGRHMSVTFIFEFPPSRDVLPTYIKIDRFCTLYTKFSIMDENDEWHSQNITSQVWKRFKQIVKNVIVIKVLNVELCDTFNSTTLW